MIRHLGRRMFLHPPAALRVAILIFAVLLYGSTGFLYYELPQNPDLTWLDGCWWAVVTVTTVGYGDLSPQSLGGEFIVAMPLMFFGIGLLGYVLSLLATALIEAKNKELHGMSDFKLKNHLVLINFPSEGKVMRVLQELERDSAFDTTRDIVLIDEALEELPAAIRKRGVRFIRGNPTRDETLSRASLDSASHALVLVREPGDPKSDNRNIAIALAIEARAGHVFTVTECVDIGTQELLRKAGSDGIVCNSRFDAHFVSHELLNPGVQEVVAELTTNLKGSQIYLTRYTGEETTFQQIQQRCHDQGHIAIGIRSGRSLINPNDSDKVATGDRVITVGRARLRRL